MNRALAGFIGLLVFGSFFDGLIAFHALVLVGLSKAPPGLTVGNHLEVYLPILAWIKQIAYVILPAGFADWLFALPSLVYFPFRVVTSSALALMLVIWARRQ